MLSNNLFNMQRKEKILVLCVDRDNDLGDKAKVKGPVVGRDEILKAAGVLALADPRTLTPIQCSRP